MLASTAKIKNPLRKISQKYLQMVTCYKRHIILINIYIIIIQPPRKQTTPVDFQRDHFTYEVCFIRDSLTLLYACNQKRLMDKMRTISDDKIVQLDNISMITSYPYVLIFNIFIHSSSKLNIN